MVKWLRKYNKQIMAGVVLFAMFSFVGGAALQSIFTPDVGNRDFARAFGETIKNKDLNLAQQDLLIFERVGFTIQQLIPHIQVEHWYLLTREAERAGIVVPDVQADAFMTQMRLTPDFLSQFSQTRIFSYPVVRATFQRFLEIEQLADRVADAAIPSDAQLRHYVQDTEKKIRVAIAPIDAHAFIDPNEPVSDAELQAQFDKYKDTMAGKSPEGFGYKFPDRVQVQYMGLTADRVEPLMAVTLDEAKAHWRKNQAKYKKVEFVDEPNPAASQPTSSSTSEPTSQPATIKKRVEREMEFSEARSQVEREIRQKKAGDVCQEAMRKAALLMLQPWQDQTADPHTGYKEHIPDVVRDSGYMQRIRGQVASQMRLEPSIIDYGESGLKTHDELAQLSTIGRTQMTVSERQQLPFADYAFRVPEFFKKEPRSETTLSLQLFQTPDTPLVYATPRIVDGRFEMQPSGWYLFRVIEADPSKPPANVGIIRDRIERDIRTMRALDRLELQVKQLYAAAQKVGLSEAWSVMDELSEKSGMANIVKPPAFARKMSRSLEVPTVTGVGAASEEFVNACFEMASTDWRAPDAAVPAPPAVTTRPAMEPSPKVTYVKLPKIQKWVVIELLGVDPVHNDRYENELRAEAYGTLRNQRGAELRNQWFEPSNIEARCDFHRLAGDQEPAPPSGATAADHEAPI